MSAQPTASEIELLIQIFEEPDHTLKTALQPSGAAKQLIERGCLTKLFTKVGGPTHIARSSYSLWRLTDQGMSEAAKLTARGLA